MISTDSDNIGAGATVMDLHSKVVAEIGNATLKHALEKVLAEKLSQSGIAYSADLISNLADHIISGNTEAFTTDDDASPIVETALVFDKSDVAELTRVFEQELKRAPEVINNIADNAAKGLLRSQRRRWPEQDEWQREVEAGFRHRLGQRWGKAIGLLRMLYTVCREIGEQGNRRRGRSSSKRNRYLHDVRYRLHARACQVTAEIIALIESGFADGAMARWRTLHEIDVVLGVIEAFGDSLAERYLVHQVVESKRALDEYRRSYYALGYRPPSKTDIENVDRAHAWAIKTYGRNFGKQYGWAAEHLQQKEPKFSDLEAAAGVARMRSHYKMASYNVHAGTKGISYKLGLIDQGTALLAGPSNAGFTEPAQNTAITLTRITSFLFRKRPRLDEVIQAKALVELSEQIPRAFLRAERQLKSEERNRVRVSQRRSSKRKVGKSA